MENKHFTDTERLDFIEKHKFYVMPHFYSNFKFLVFSNELFGAEARSENLREAIDKVMGEIN